MTRSESTYLDLLRSLTALAVVFSHAGQLYSLPDGGRWGHQAIVVFFVLSGYVISYVADTRESDLRTFMVARIARLWSVLVPALALTVACDIVGHSLGWNSRGFHLSPVDYPLVRIGAMLAFLSESWVSIQPLSNGAAWSLCLEFWYYAAFGFWTFLRPGWWRMGLTGAALLLSGHKGLLLLPIWLLGVALQRIVGLRRHPAWVDAALWGGALVLACGLVEFAYGPAIALMGREIDPWINRHLAEARTFWVDWVLGALVAAHLLGARCVAPWLPLHRASAAIRWCAGISFATYLFHFPLLHLTAAFLPPNQGWLAIFLTLTVIAALGPAAERSKGWWRRRLDSLVCFALTIRIVRNARDMVGPLRRSPNP